MTNAIFLGAGITNLVQSLIFLGLLKSLHVNVLGVASDGTRSADEEGVFDHSLNHVPEFPFSFVPVPHAAVSRMCPHRSSTAVVCWLLLSPSLTLSHTRTRTPC